MIRKKTFLQLAILFWGVCFFSFQSAAQSPADSLLDFITANKGRVSFCLSKNDTTIAAVNDNDQKPLAQVVNMMIAIEFAKQAGKGVFDENTYVAISDLNKYYIPNTPDSAIQPAWLEYEKLLNHIKNDSIHMVDIARGMTIFNSNANAEYLLDFLGFDNVKNNAQAFGLRKHTAIFPIVSSLFMYQTNPKNTASKVLKGIRHMSEEQYCKAIFRIHESLKNDTSLRIQFKSEQFTTEMQKMWNSRLTLGTTKEYVEVCKMLNNRKLLPEPCYEIIAEVLEYYMETPASLKWLKHAGMKGGTTPWVFNKVLYGTTKEDTKIELAYFLNDLSSDENKRVKEWSTQFELYILSSEEFRQKLIYKLGQ